MTGDFKLSPSRDTRDVVTIRLRFSEEREQTIRLDRNDYVITSNKRDLRSESVQSEVRTCKWHNSVSFEATDL